MTTPEDLTASEATELLEHVRSKRRVRLIVEADLDPIPGWGNSADDWQQMLQRMLGDVVGHYNPIVTIGDDA